MADVNDDPNILRATLYANTLGYPEDPGKYFVCGHETFYKVLDDRCVYNVTGEVTLTPQLGTSDAFTIRKVFVGNDNNWKRPTLCIWVSLPSFGGQLHWHPEGATPFVTINGVEKGGDNHNGGWELEGFGVNARGPEPGLDNAQHYVYEIWGHFGIRGYEFRITRVGYSLQAVGYLRPQP